MIQEKAIMGEKAMMEETKMTGDEETDEEQSEGFSTCEQFQSLLADTDGVECGE